MPPLAPLCVALLLCAPLALHTPAVPSAEPALLQASLRAALNEAAAGEPSALIATLEPIRSGSASTAFARLADLPLDPAAQGGLTRSSPPPPGIPASLEQALTRLWSGLQEAQLHREAAFSRLTSEEIDWLTATLPSAGRLRRATADGGGTPEERATYEAFIALGDRVDRPALARAGNALLLAVEEAQPLIPSTPFPHAAAAPSRCAEGDVVFEDPTCELVVGGYGANRYTANTTLLIDLGGSDTYLNNAGGAYLGAALLLDLGASPDVYLDPKGRQRAIQGGGVWGVGLLVDEGGGDRYDATSPDPDRFIASQGTGNTGVGILWDQGAGHDTYASPRGAHGVGLIGYGLLLDEGGDDHYRLPVGFDSEAGQGAACYGSAAALIDRGEGADTYDAGVADMQGFGCVGSTGILYDGGGSDLYLIRSGPGILSGKAVQQSGYSQGYGELGGSGLLLDAGGDDTYLIESLLGLMSEAINAQGAALFGGIGALIDLQGRDAYTAKGGCQGYAVAATGILVDYGGDEDSYQCETPALIGRAGGNNATWSRGIGGIGADRYRGPAAPPILEARAR